MNKTFNYGDCDRCGGTVVEKLVQQVCSRKGRAAVIVNDVPAGVCQQCGERYFRSDVAERLEAITKESSRSGKQISLPLFPYAA